MKNISVKTDPEKKRTFSWQKKSTSHFLCPVDSLTNSIQCIRLFISNVLKVIIMLIIMMIYYLLERKTRFFLTLVIASLDLNVLDVILIYSYTENGDLFLKFRIYLNYYNFPPITDFIKTYLTIKGLKYLKIYSFL